MVDAERLAIAQAMYKALGSIVGTKDPDNLRGQVSNRLLEAYKAGESDRMPLTVNGTRVGSLTVRAAKSEEVRKLELDDANALLAWLGQNPVACARVLMDSMGTLTKYLAETGEVPDGCEVVTHTKVTPPTTAITGCKPEDVAGALGNELPNAVMGLFE